MGGTNTRRSDALLVAIPVVFFACVLAFFGLRFIKTFRWQDTPFRLEEVAPDAQAIVVWAGCNSENRIASVEEDEDTIRIRHQLRRNTDDDCINSAVAELAAPWNSRLIVDVASGRQWYIDPVTMQWGFVEEGVEPPRRFLPLPQRFDACTDLPAPAPEGADVTGEHDEVVVAGDVVSVPWLPGVGAVSQARRSAAVECWTGEDWQPVWAAEGLCPDGATMPMAVVHPDRHVDVRPCPARAAQIAVPSEAVAGTHRVRVVAERCDSDQDVCAETVIEGRFVVADAVG